MGLDEHTLSVHEALGGSPAPTSKNIHALNCATTEEKAWNKADGAVQATPSSVWGMWVVEPVSRRDTAGGRKWTAAGHGVPSVLSVSQEEKRSRPPDK